MVSFSRKHKEAEASGLSTRGAVLAIAGILAILALAVTVVALWPEIEFRYQRHRFQKGTAEEQLEALEWICLHRLDTGMTREEVERILGEPLWKRFQIWEVEEKRSSYSFPKEHCGPDYRTLVFEDGRYFAVLVPVLDD